MLVMTCISKKHGTLVDIRKRDMEGNRTVIKVWKGVSIFSYCIQGVDTVLVMIEIADGTIICQFQTPVKSRVTLTWLPVHLITMTYLGYFI